jgi:site-specific DNA-cytosine methylase
VLRDILEDDFDSERDKAHCIDANYYKGASVDQYKKKHRRQLVNKPIKVGMNVEEVKIRKYKVDEKALQKLLRSAKKESKKTIKDIAKECNVPLTKAEHWFRTDSSFAIPKDTVWIKLKFVLGITTNEFDKALLEFEYRDGVYESTQRVYSDQGKSPTLTATNKEQMIETKPKQVGVAVDIKGHDILKRVYSPDGKSPTVNTCQGGNREPKVVTGGALRGRYINDETKQMLEMRKDKKSNAITTVGKDSLVVENLPDKSQTIKSQYYKSSRANFERQGTFHATGVQQEDLTWRKLTPLECERLQTVPDNYTNHVSNSRRYAMLGNGWTVEVIKHIYKNMEY